jgi:hypothetical protein
MNRRFLQLTLLKLVLSSSLMFPAFLSAQQFNYTLYGDLLAGFRKPGVGTYELVVHIGNITNFEQLPPASTITITNYIPTQLSNAFADGFGGLSWSVSSAFQGLAAWAGFPTTTLWYTVPRTNPQNQSIAPARYSTSSQSYVRQNMLGFDTGAGTISGQLGASNINNTPYLVREPAWDGVSQVRNELTWWITDSGNSAYNGFGLPLNLENVTPASFTSAEVSDLYRSRPTGYLDPQTGLSTGPAYFVGFFKFNPDGTMTFTRASTNSAAPPAPQIVSAVRSGSTSTIYFTTTNGATYTLYYTNAAGLKTPASTWPASPSTVVGNGGTNSLSDMTTDPIRFYRVGAH